MNWIEATAERIAKIILADNRTPPLVRDVLLGPLKDALAAVIDNDSCRLCGAPTTCVYNINFTAVRICPECALTIMRIKP